MTVDYATGEGEATPGDDYVETSGTLTFAATKARAAREGRSPRTGEAIAIAASKAPAFKAGKTLRDAVRQ